MNNQIAIGIITKPSLQNEEEPGIFFSSIGKNVTATKNSFLRRFIDNEQYQYFVIYNTNNELPPLSVNSLRIVAEQYVNTIISTGINYLTGPLKTGTVIDYGSVKINVSNGSEQKVVLEVFTRQAIDKIGYLDVRLNDSLCSMDYAIRLGSTNLYPSSIDKTTPWLFDIVQKDDKVAKQTLEMYSSGWYKYKYNVLPWDQLIPSIDDLKPQLKEIKNGNK
jgi:hypothetical protein